MFFSVNYSRSARQLVQSGRIDIDCFKLYENEALLIEASALKPVRIHFSFQAGSADAFVPERLDTVLRFLERSPTENVNTHLAVSGNPGAQEYIDGVGRDIEQLCQIFGREKVIAENVFPQGIDSHPGPDPAVISKIIRSHAIGFLFDISHAKLAATMRGEDVQLYIQALPLEQVREVHISGTRIDPATGIITDHYPMTQPDYELVHWVFELTQAGQMSMPDLVAVEMGGVGGVLEERVTLYDLAEAMPRLHRMLRRDTGLKAA